MPRGLRYDAVAKTLHWLIALAIVSMLAIGWTMMNLPRDNPARFGLFQWHKSIGITILFLSLARLGWRLIHTPPPYPAKMPKWELIAARLTHLCFYVLIIGMPLTGWIIVSTSPLNLPTMLYGLIQWPNLPILPGLDNKKAISHFTGNLHGVLAYILAALLVIHVAAALKHHFMDKDDVLTRMAPVFLTRTLNVLRKQKA